MARIAGVDIPKNKRGVISLTYIFGLGKSRAIEILDKAQVSQDKKVQDWNDDELNKVVDFNPSIPQTTKCELLRVIELFYPS